MSRARGLQFLACERHRLIVVKLARCLEATEECSQVIRANGALDDLAFGDMRLCRVFAKDGCDLGVEIDTHSFPGGHSWTVPTLGKRPPTEVSVLPAWTKVSIFAREESVFTQGMPLVDPAGRFL